MNKVSVKTFFSDFQNFVNQLLRAYTEIEPVADIKINLKKASIVLGDDEKYKLVIMFEPIEFTKKSLVSALYDAIIPSIAIPIMIPEEPNLDKANTNKLYLRSDDLENQNTIIFSIAFILWSKTPVDNIGDTIIRRNFIFRTDTHSFREW